MNRVQSLAVIAFLLFQVGLSADDQAVELRPGSLMAEFIDADIGTMSPEELVDWAKSLGLDPGTDPKKAIQEYYGGLRSDSPLVVHQDPQITPSSEPGQKAEQSIKVQKAEQVEYFTIDEIDEKFMRLSGGVVLELSDKKTGVTHNISADQIIISRKTDFVSARGNIKYKKTTNGKTEVFTGDDLLFNSKNYESWIINVDSSVANAKDRQRYTAEKAYKSTKSLSILRDVNITSSVWDPPAYKIHADKLFLLQTGEWYIEGAVLYVGEIPVFYFPLFFNPSDELVFHPSIGYNDYYGTYLQTTTYLLGEKKDKTALLDALKISIPQDDPNGNTNVELKGLFLRQVQEAAEKKESTTDAPVTLKLIGDVYARFGAIISLRLEAEKASVFKDTKIGLGIAYTKNIYAGQTYTNVKFDGSKVSDRTSGSYFFGNEIPFRFFFDIQSSIEVLTTKFNISLPVYSDPSVWSDFSQRSENIEWLKMLKLKLDDKPDVQTQDPTKNRLDFIVSMASPIDLKLSPPWVESLSINKFELKLGLKTLQLTNQNVLDTGAFKTSNLITYVLDSATLPSVGLSIKGGLTLPNTSQQNKPSEESSAGLLEPWEDMLDPKNEPEVDGKMPEDDPSLEFLPSISKQASLGSGDSKWTLGYSVSPLLDLIGYFSSNTGKGYAEIDNSARYWAMIKNLTANMKNELGLGGSVFDFQNQISYRFGLSDLIWQNETLSAQTIKLIQSDLDRSFANILDQKTDVSFNPLISVDFLRTSAITYSVSTNLYSKTFLGIGGSGESTYKETYFGFNKENFKAHLATASLNFTVPQFSAKTSYSYNIYPIAPGSAFSYALEYNSPFLVASVSSGLRWDEENEMTPLDVNSSARLIFDPSPQPLSLSETLIYNLKDKKFRSFDSLLNLNFFTADLLFTDNSYVNWEKGANVFKAQTETNFQLDSYNFTLKPKIEIEPYWKNRVNFALTPVLDYRQSVVDVRNSYLTAGIDIDFSVFELISVKVGIKSQNRRMFRYFDQLSSRVGLPKLDLFEDLFGSYNFANTQDRQKSSFKFQTINIEAVHHMGDWDLTLSYVAEPKPNTANLSLGYKWQYTLGFDLSWKPIPLVKTKLTSNNDVLKVE